MGENGSGAEVGEGKMGGEGKRCNKKKSIKLLSKGRNQRCLLPSNKATARSVREQKILGLTSPLQACANQVGGIKERELSHALN